jgi:hypothetical protein
MRAPLPPTATFALRVWTALFVPQVRGVQQFRYDLLTHRPSELTRAHRDIHHHDGISPPNGCHNLLTTMIIVRWIAWAALAAVVVLSLVPVGLRPVSALPHIYEHFTVFLLVGLAFGMAYPGQRLAIGLASVPTAAAIELLQLFVPGRHARVSDFVINATGACVGLALASVITRIRQLT